MAIISQGLFSDPACTQMAQAWDVGAAAATGSAAELSFWPQYQPGLYQPWGQVPRGIFTSSVPAGEVTLSGGGTIYSRAIQQTWPTQGALAEDWMNEGQSGKIYNALFLGQTNEENEEDRGSIWLSIIAPDSDNRVWSIRMGVYTETKGQDGIRETWNYFGKNFDIDTSIYFTAQEGYPQVKAFRLFVEESEFILLAFGISAANEVPTGQSTFILIPLDYFKVKESRPWVGPPGEDDSEDGFAPEDEIHDTIASTEVAPNDLYDANNNPAGMGIKVLIPNWIDRPGTLMEKRTNVLGRIQAAIYRGTSQGIFNLFTQQWDSLLGGTGNRAADEIQAMLSAIICCHSLPVISKTGTYLNGWSSMNTIAGYSIDLDEFDVNYQIGSIGRHSIVQESWTANPIGPRLNCFLDYEPYTQITLKLPFFPPISLPPSLVYDSVMTFVFTIDLITGFLSCDVRINELIYTTMTTNVKTDMPFFGTGTSGAGLSKIATAVSGAMSGSELNMSSAISAGMNFANEVSLAGTGVVVGKEGSSNLAPLFAPRSGYLIITHPRAAIPVSRSGKQTFMDEVGMAANLAYKVGECAGGWNKFSSVDLSTVQAPQAIKDDILAQLMQGVYIK